MMQLKSQDRCFQIRLMSIEKGTGNFLSDALLFCRTWEEHVVYKNCSECQKQFLYTTCSPQV